METEAAKIEKTVEISPKKIGIVILAILAIAGAFLITHRENKPPVADFQLTKDCYDYLPCQFDATKSYDPDGKIVSYTWQANGGRSATIPVPLTIGVFKEGLNNALLIVTDDKGLSGSITKEFTVNPQYELKIPSASTKEEQIKLIKSLCKSPVKKTNYTNYYNGYINDMHVHLIPGQEPYNYTIALLTAANEFGVKRMALRQYGAGVEGDRNYERENDKLVSEIAGLCPERFDPFLAAVYPDDTSSVEYVKKSLGEYPWRGVGEIYIKNKLHGGYYTKEISTLANTSTMIQIYKMLAERNIPFHFHLDASTKEDVEAVKQAMKENPDTIFIWAHTCNGRPELTDEFKNLYCESELTLNNTLAVQIYSDKTILGTDASVISDNVSLTQDFHFIIESSRSVLLGNRIEEADLVAHGNYEKAVGAK